MRRTETLFTSPSRPEANAVLVLGEFEHEGLQAKIGALGLRNIMQSLRSGPKYWHRIAAAVRGLNDAGQLNAAFVYLPTPTLLAISDEKYDSALRALVDEMARARALVFLYEDNLLGIIEPPPWYYEHENDTDRREYYRDYLRRLGRSDATDVELDEYLNPPAHRKSLPTKEQWLKENVTLIARTNAVIDEILAPKVELVPFRQRGEVTLRIIDCLDDLADGVLLRVYVPKGRYQEEQVSQLLSMFARYVREIEHREFAIDRRDTMRGTTYVFKARASTNLGDVQHSLARFDEFMAKAMADPETAIASLQGQGVDHERSRALVEVYVRDYRRLLLDMRHELERRKLTLSHRMEADLLDVNNTPAFVAIERDHPSTLLTIVGNRGPVTVALPGSTMTLGRQSSQYIETLTNGNVNYGPEDEQLLALMASIDDKVAALSLRSDLERLSDNGIPQPEKHTAAQRLKTFIYKVGREVGGKLTDVGVKALIAYVEGRIKSGPV